MLTPGRIERIITEATNTEDGRIQQLAQTLLAEWMSADTRHNFCDVIRTRIAQELESDLQNRALDRLSAIRDTIANEASDAAKAEQRNRQSADAMREEVLKVYEIIERIGRGVVYFGSARTKPGDRYYELGRELGREVYELLGSPTWTGAGPGQMEAPIYGAKEAGGPIGGIKIVLDNGYEQDVSPAFGKDEYCECRFFGPRKVGLVDATMRQEENDHTGLIILPGGFGTNDEFYEYLTLGQLKKLGTAHPIPVLLMNHDGFYDHMIKHHEECMRRGTVSESDINLYQICNTNRDALEYLANYYKIESDRRSFTSKELLED